MGESQQIALYTWQKICFNNVKIVILQISIIKKVFEFCFSFCSPAWRTKTDHLHMHCDLRRQVKIVTSTDLLMIGIRTYTVFDTAFRNVYMVNRLYSELEPQFLIEWFKPPLQ